MSRPVDWKQRDLARDPRHSYIVQAPAGSGKTELLSQRMLGLLARSENPEEVVAITFTRKAAAEMRFRLLKHLQDAANPGKPIEDLQEHEKISRELALKVLKVSDSRDWNLLEQPSRLRIRTIDGLCSELARQLPILSGLGGSHQIADDSQALYHQAATRTMASIESENDELKADVVRVLERYDNQYDRLVKLLTGMLENREQWLQHLLDARLDDGSFDRQGLEYALRFLVESQLQEIRANIPDDLLEKLPPLYNYALSNSPQNKAELEALLNACGGFNCNYLDLPISAESLPHWRTMISTLLTKGGTWIKVVNAASGFPAPSTAKGEEKLRRQSWKNEYTGLVKQLSNELNAQFNRVRTLPRPGYSDTDWASLESLMRILLRAAAEWKLVMAESGELDYSEIVARAIESLGHDDAPSDLALRLDYRIQHLLVDEFQDTSSVQVRLLNQLTGGWCDGDGRTLFLVGDPMQSIYRFRKAEVSLFIQAWAGNLLTHIRLQPLRLSVNFRSTQVILNWVNRAFPEVMPAEDDPINGAVSYASADTRPNVPVNGEVLCQILPENDYVEEARQVIEVIRQSPPEDTIAILVRARNHASEIIAALEQENLSYQAIDFTPLKDTPLIQDLVSLTLALNQPADRLAWLATLRTPFIGLDLNDLDELVNAEYKTTIFDSLNSRGGHLGPEGRQRLQRVLPVLEQALVYRGRRSIRLLIESAWIKLGGPACIGKDSELEDATTYFKLLTSMEAEGLSIDRDSINQRMDNLYAQADSQSGNKLLITTIYSAKGLQFDSVILPGLNRKPGSDQGKLLHWFELADPANHPEGIVLSPMRNSADKEMNKTAGDLIEFISGIEKQRKILEDGRLLYVAATRAIHSLYLFACIKPNARDEINANPNSLLGRLWDVLKAEQIPLINQAINRLEENRTEDATAATDGPEPGSSVESPALPQQYRRLGYNWQIPATPCSVTTGLQEPLESSDYIEFNWAGQDARRTGELVHRLLQQIGEIGIIQWNNTNGFKKRENWCRHQLAGEGVIAEKADNILSRVAEAINICLLSEKGQWLLRNHEDAHCEYEITTLVEDKPKRIVLDRTFIAEGERWIIDYKTSSHKGGDLDVFLEQEAKRYHQQLQTYKNAMQLSDSRPVRAALYFPLLDQFVELSLS
ncbi:MAG: UvrD-helicase domain-containing protein [Proteobacteria bacterium]|nr:UvrD-helicase domain-containing protein [Pseudomonadota bacterium]